MSPEDLEHLGRVRWPASGGVHELAGFSEVGGAHDRRSDYRQLLRIFCTEDVEAVDGAAWYAYGLPRPEPDGFAVDGPSLAHP